MEKQFTSDSATRIPITEHPKFEASRLFNVWLAEQQLSLLLTTYEASRLFLVGLNEQHKLSILSREFERCMGAYAYQDELYVSTAYQLWCLKNMLPANEHYQGYDKLYSPRYSYVTGDIDIHDIVVEDDGRIVFVNTLFSCLATISKTNNFKALWTPPFISRLAAEDRCHLNGLALRDGKARYVTAVSKTDVFEGWREHIQNGGMVIDISDNTILLEGLSMPHSPRWYQDKLWLLDSGNGNFGYLDMSTGKFETVAFCPGYARGLNFYGHYAVIGLSNLRDSTNFSTKLALRQKLEEKNVSPRCGVQVIDLRTGDTVHSLSIQGSVNEIYDVIILPKVTCPMAFGFKTSEIRHHISIDYDNLNQ